MLSRDSTSAPVVRDEIATLFERVEVGGETRYVPFTKRLIWLRQSEAKVVIRYNGNVVDERSTLNDYYGFLTSIEGTVGDDVARFIEHFGIVAGDKLSVDIDARVYDSPRLADESSEAVTQNANPTYKGRYLYTPRDGSGGKWWFTSDKPVRRGEGDGSYEVMPTLEPVDVFTQDALFSSVRDGVDGTIPANLAEWLTQQRKAIPRLGFKHFKGPGSFIRVQVDGRCYSTIEFTDPERGWKLKAVRKDSEVSAMIHEEAVRLANEKYPEG